MARANNVIIIVMALMILAPADVEVTEARKTCTIGLGIRCSTPQDCNACSQKFPGGQGICDGIWPNQLCSCAYPCGPPDPPAPIERKCRGGGGACDACGNSCCNQTCANKFKNGVGSCEFFAGANLCNCYYTC